MMKDSLSENLVRNLSWQYFDALVLLRLPLGELEDQMKLSRRESCSNHQPSVARDTASSVLRKNRFRWPSVTDRWHTTIILYIIMIYGVFGSSLLIKSTDSMIIILLYHNIIIYKIIVVRPSVRNGSSMEMIRPRDTRCSIYGYRRLEGRDED